MDRVDFYSIICGFLAMFAAALLAMAWGYEGMSFARPWPHLTSLAVLAEMLLMRWMGPVPGMLLMMLLEPLKTRWPKARVEQWQDNLLYLCIPLTAVALTFPMLRLMRAMAP